MTLDSAITIIVRIRLGSIMGQERSIIKSTVKRRKEGKGYQCTIGSNYGTNQGRTGFNK
jgi:hypothetical protein